MRTSVRGSCLKKVVVGLAVALAVVGVIAGYSYRVYKQAFLFDSERVISSFQEAVPGAVVPDGYSGLMAFDYRGTGLKQDTLLASLARTRDNPTPDGYPERILDEPSMQFQAFNFPADTDAKPAMWETKFESEVRQSREMVGSKTVTKAVGGKEIELQDSLSRDDGGKEYREYRLDLMMEERTTFLLISAPVDDFDTEVADEFLKSLTLP